jgi:hypothetical protein
MGAKLFQFDSLRPNVAGGYQFVKAEPRFEEVTFWEWCCIRLAQQDVLLQAAFHQTILANKRALRYRRSCLCYADPVPPRDRCLYQCAGSEVVCTSLPICFRGSHSTGGSFVQFDRVHVARRFLLVCCVYTSPVCILDCKYVPGPLTCCRCPLRPPFTSALHDHLSFTAASSNPSTASLQQFAWMIRL